MVDIDLVIFTAPLDDSHEHPARRVLLEAMQLMVSDIHSLCPVTMSMPELPVNVVSLAMCVCVLEIAVSVIIRVILKLETVLELGMSFKGRIPLVCIDYRRFQLDKTFPQSLADCRD